MIVEREIAIRAPRERVWETVMDPHCLERWVTIHRELESAPEGALEEGSELTQSLRMAGRTFTVRWKVTSVKRPSRVVWQGRGPMRTKAAIRYGFEDDGDATRFSYFNEYELPGGPAGRIAGRMMSRVAARETQRSLERLKELIES